MGYCSLEDVKDYLGIPAATTDDDALLQNLIERASKAIDTHCGRTFEMATETRYFESDALSPIDHRTLILDKDLISITTLTNGDSDGTTITSSDYWLIPRNDGPPYYGIRLKSDATEPWQWDVDCWVSVVGTWGWGNAPPEDVVMACIRWTGYMYHQKDTPIYETTAFPESGVLTTPRGIPRDVELMLMNYRRAVG